MIAKVKFIRVVKDGVVILNYEPVLGYAKKHGVSLEEAVYAVLKSFGIVCKKGYFDFSVHEDDSIDVDIEDGGSAGGVEAFDGSIDDTNSVLNGKSSESVKSSSSVNPRASDGKNDRYESLACEVEDMNEGLSREMAEDWLFRVSQSTKGIVDTINPREMRAKNSSIKGNDNYNRRCFATSMKANDMMIVQNPCRYCITLTQKHQSETEELMAENKQFYYDVSHQFHNMYRTNKGYFLIMWEAQLNGRLHCHAMFYSENWWSEEDESAEDGEKATGKLLMYLQERFGSFCGIDCNVVKGDKALSYVLKTYKYGAEKLCRQIKKEGKELEDEQLECVFGTMITQSLGLHQRQLMKGKVLRVHKPNESVKKSIPESIELDDDDPDLIAMQKFERGEITKEEYLPHWLNIVKKFFPCATHCIEVVKCVKNEHESNYIPSENGTIAKMKKKARIETYGNKCKDCVLMALYGLGLAKVSVS